MQDKPQSPLPRGDLNYAPPRQRTQIKQRRKPREPRRRIQLPSVVKPAGFYVSPRIQRAWFPDDYHWWCAHYFLNLVHIKWCFWKANAEGYSQLHSKLLRRIIPLPVLKKVKEVLTKRGVIECDCRVVVGSKALGYRLTSDYRDTHWVVCTDEKLNRTIARVYAAEDRATLPVHHWLKAKLGLLHFDLERAATIIATLKPDRGSGLGATEYRSLVAQQCQRIANGDHWFTVDEYGRVHSPLTNLPHELRCCLSVNSQPLVGRDLRNSQPLIFSILVERFQSITPMNRWKLCTRKFDSDNPYHAPNHSLQTTNPPTQPTRIKGLSKPLTPDSDSDLRDLRLDMAPAAKSKFRRVCEQGVFYESLMTEGQRAKGERGRDRLKGLFYGVLFGENRSKGRFPSQTRLRFQRLYPDEAKVLRELKKRNYRHSSHLLQNWEATIFIHRICGRIKRGKPTTPVFTIHDSILTTPEHVSYVEAIILEEFQKLGVTPILKKEVYE